MTSSSYALVYYGSKKTSLLDSTPFIELKGNNLEKVVYLPILEVLTNRSLHGNNCSLYTCIMLLKTKQFNGVLGFFCEHFSHGKIFD